MAEIDTSSVRARKDGGAIYVLSVRLTREEHERLLIAADTMDAAARDVLATLLEGALARAVEIMKRG
jgi:hypothetical protein